MPDADLPESAARIIARRYFGVHAAAAVVGAAAIGAWSTRLERSTEAALVGALLVFALACGWSLRATAARRFPLNAAMCVTAAVTLVLTSCVALAYREGLHSPVLGLGSVAVGVAAAVMRPRLGLALGGLALLQIGGLAFAESAGWPAPTLLGTGQMPLGLAFVCQVLAVGCATAGGSLIARVLDLYLQAAAQREQRFLGLLRIAADWYWEQDQHFRYTYLSEPAAGTQRLARTERLDQTPWELADMGLTDEQLDAHRADLEDHRPFNGLLARRRSARGKWRTVSLSGEPRFDANGVFCGYWGVARDVTGEVRAQHAVTASETRYRELFTRSPSPLLLHRRGIVFDANEAAARLFGFADAASMSGVDFISLYPVGTARAHGVQRLAELERMAVGEGLAVTDIQVRSVDGRLLSVQATAVRVDTVSGPASLSIFFDITARKAVEGALRRSEAMLSHLFATSPDCIALTELATGRYAMVNPAFCRVTGFHADEVVGRTDAELGLWQDPRHADLLIARLQADGSVNDLGAVLRSKSGAPVSMLISAGRFAMDRREYLVVNARDVTESERTRLQHTAILERASIGIAFTRDRRFAQANPYFERMFGWQPGELLGESCTSVLADEDSHDEIDAVSSAQRTSGQPFELECRMRRRDGSLFRCRLLARAVDPNDPAGGGTIWIAEDVTERRRLDEALAAARDAAEAASQAKSAFLANTSHEIRTPLNGLLGLARLAMQDGLAEPRRQQYLAQILDSAQSLAGIMSDILDVSKIEAGKIALEDLPFDLHETLHAVHKGYQSLAEVKGLALRLSINPQLPRTVHGDPVRVRQILSNFITNALKFTEAGEVRIDAGLAHSGSLRFAVSDTGPGIAIEMQARLFLPFSQADTSTTRRFGGTGLGLSICRELALLMGGQVGVDSEPGRGSRFWAELPLLASAPLAPAADAAAGESAALQRARVLMVEDNPVNMMIGVAMLENWGVRVAQAFDGRMAVGAVHDAVRSGDPFDAVLMDVQMPVMGGHEAARELRRHWHAAELPIIALTAAALVSERDEALAAGMNDFLTKPIDPLKLRGTLARLVSMREARAA